MASQVLLKGSNSTSLKKPFRSQVEAAIAFLRSTQLQILTQCTKWRRGGEGKKIAIYKSKRAALLHIWVHLIPVIASILVVTLNLRTFYIGKFPINGLTGLQFTSKLLEILIQASIGTLVLAFIRSSVIGDKPLPFGGLITPIRITDVSSLWSLELWGFLTSRSRTLALCVILPFAVVLANLVGPSGAVLLLPRPIDLPLNRTLIFYSRSDLIYPKHIGLVNGSLLGEVSLQNMNISALTAASENLWEVDVNTYRKLRLAANVNEHVSQSIATLPSLSTQTQTGDKTVWQSTAPYVFVDCWENLSPVQVVTDPNAQYVNFGPNKAYLNHAMPFSWLTSNSSRQSDANLATLPFILDTDEGYGYSIVWARSPTSNNSLLMVLGLSGPPYTNWETIACTIDAYWANTTSTKVQGEPIVNQIPTSGIDSPEQVLAQLTEKTLTSLDADWTSSIYNLAYGEGLNKLDFDFNFWKYFPASLVVAMAYTSDSISDPTWDPQVFWTSRGYTIPLDWINMTSQVYNNWLAYINKNQLLKHFETVYVRSYTQDWIDPSSLARDEQRDYLSGYGYDSSTTTVKLSLAVIMLYTTIALAYLIYTLITGNVASSWDSVAEVIALALNSQIPKSLENTSAGIATIEIFRQPVNIRVNDHDSLEIVFDADKQSEPYFKVEPNEKY